MEWIWPQIHATPVQIDHCLPILWAMRTTLSLCSLRWGGRAIEVMRGLSEWSKAYPYELVLFSIAGCIWWIIWLTQRGISMLQYHIIRDQKWKDVLPKLLPWVFSGGQRPCIPAARLYSGSTLSCAFTAWSFTPWQGDNRRTPENPAKPSIPGSETGPNPLH